MAGTRLLQATLSSLIFAFWLTGAATVRAEEALVAVAANFAPAAALLKERFEAESDHSLRLASGSTGKLYAQIRNGAPFDVLLAADQLRPRLLDEAGLSVPGSRFSYAHGRVGIWVPGAAPNQASVRSLLNATDTIALANPELAPYGVAAQEVLTVLALSDDPETRRVRGENVAQAYAMVASGNATAGLVAWSLLVLKAQQAESWLVPETWHAPIRQDAVLLGRAAENSAAVAFLTYLRSADAIATMTAHGYASQLSRQN